MNEGLPDIVFFSIYYFLYYYNIVTLSGVCSVLPIKTKYSLSSVPY